MEISENSPAVVTFMDTRKRVQKSDCLVSATVFKRDVRIAFSYIGRPPLRQFGTRSKINQFSKRSAKRLRHKVRNSDDQLKTFITLTYPKDFPCNGIETKSHLNAFLQYLRRKKIKYIWVLEFQERGAPHYHIIATGFIPKEELSRRWYTIVNSGDEKHLKAGTRIEAIKSKNHLYGYLSQYIQKLYQKTVPDGFENVGRFWGSSRNLIEFVFYHFRSTYDTAARSIRLLRKWYRSHLRAWGIKWKWQGAGFTALDGTEFVNQLRELRI